MKRIVHALAAAAAVLSCAGAPPALAQPPAYPDRPIKLIVGGPPGASSDLITRLVGERFGKALGHARKTRSL